jgi:hypothetical protein
MPVCSYCDCKVPSQRFKTVRHKKEIIFLCTDGDDSGCYSKWKHLQSAKRAALDILNIAKGCNLGMCEKAIRNTFRISKIRELSLRILERLLTSVKKILRKGTTAIKKLLRQIKTLTKIVGLETHYQQLKKALI